MNGHTLFLLQVPEGARKTFASLPASVYFLENIGKDF